MTIRGCGAATNFDLARSQPSLPIVYALWTAGAAGQHLRALLQEVRLGNLGLAREARDLITQLGAEAYLLAAARFCFEQAAAALERAQPPEWASDALLAAARQVFPAAHMEA